jgi:dihydroorotate dehydrogenase
MNRGRAVLPLYEIFFNAVLRWLDAERAHRLAERMMRAFGAVPGALRITDRLLSPHDPALRVRAIGNEFRTPLCVAAGMDKNARWYASLAALGFGGVEVGTVTAEAQPGNETPRLARAINQRALFNRLGFPSEGAAKVSKRLRNRPIDFVLGVNIGKTKNVDLEHAVEDYRASVRALAPHADYIALNVSSPNTPGLTDLQRVGHLDALVAGVRAELKGLGSLTVPVVLKLGPDLPDAELEQIAALALRQRLDGIIAVNTTTKTDTVQMTPALERCHAKGGGFSGPPLKARSHEVLRLLRRCVGDQVPLVSVGGVEDAEDAWQRILAGATLLQAHTAFVYSGPLWPRRVNRGLTKSLRDSPWATIEEAIGKGVDSKADFLEAATQRSQRPLAAAPPTAV